MYSYYGPISTELYDFTKPVGHSINGDIEYYLHRLTGTKGKVLEAGVGSGRFLIPLLETGFDVDGIDNSPEMLASCRKRCTERGLHARLYEGNLSNFSLNTKYEAVIMPTGTFCLIEHSKEAIDALTCIYHHLVPGGRLILDLLLPLHWRTGEVTTSYYQLSDTEGIALESKSIEMDWSNQTTLTVLKYEKWKNGKLIDTELQRFPLQWYGIEEFQQILKNIGFSNITCSADYTHNKKPSIESGLVTFEAIRK